MRYNIEISVILYFDIIRCQIWSNSLSENVPSVVSKIYIKKLKSNSCRSFKVSFSKQRLQFHFRRYVTEFRCQVLIARLYSLTT